MKKSIFVGILLLSNLSAISNGEKLFKKCGICHGEKAQKHSLNVSKIIAGMPAKEIVATLKLYQSKHYNQYGYGKMMEGQATKLSDKQCEEVANYIASLPKVTEEVHNKDTPHVTHEKDDYNTFIKNFFKNNPNPNASLREANKLRKEHNKK